MHKSFFLPIFFILVGTFGLQASAAEIVCTNVDDEAKTHYKSNVSASKTESGKKCTVSVDGASASSVTNPTIPALSFCFRIHSQTAFRDRRLVAQIIPVLTGASVPGFRLSRSISIGGPGFSPRDCTVILRKIASSSSSFDSEMHQEVKKRGLEDPIYRCLRDGRDGSGVDCSTSGRQRIIMFRTKFGDHTLSVPVRR